MPAAPDADAPTEATGGRGRAGPAWALAGLVVAAAAAYVAYALQANVPRFLLDELYYLEAGTSLALGDGLRFRDQAWGYGPGYPALIALVVRATDDQETAYHAVRALGGLAWAAALVPVNLLARRVVPPWWAVAVAVAVAVLPTTTYVSLVMTESVTFLVVSCAVLAMARVLERPSVPGQVGVLALVGAALALRTQMLMLAAAWVAAIVLVELVPRGRAPVREALRRWGATAALLVAGALLLGGLALRAGRSPVGAYDTLVRAVSPLDLATAVAHQAGDAVLTLAMIPVVGAALTLVRWWPAVRAGERRQLAVGALAVALVVVFGVGVGVFASSEYAVGSLHDRNLFYVYPLVLALFARWLADGLPRPRRALLVATAAVALAVAMLPFAEIAAEGWLPQHEAPGTEVWGIVGRTGLPLWLVIPAFAAGCLALAAWLPPRLRLVLVVPVALLLVGNTTWAWRSAFIDPAANGVAPRGERSWVDAAIGQDARATALIRQFPGCPTSEERSAVMTLFFNRSALDSVGLGSPGPARGRLGTVELDGAVRVDGEPLVARYVIASPVIELEGRRLASGSPAGLVLWQTDGRVVVTDPDAVAGAADPCAEDDG